MPRLTFVVDRSTRSAPGTCDYMTNRASMSDCGAPGAFWYPAYGGGVAVLCDKHGAKHFPVGAQRITDRTWHGGGEPEEAT